MDRLIIRLEPIERGEQSPEADQQLVRLRISEDDPDRGRDRVRVVPYETRNLRLEGPTQPLELHDQPPYRPIQLVRPLKLRVEVGKRVDIVHYERTLQPCKKAQLGASAEPHSRALGWFS